MKKVHTYNFKDMTDREIMKAYDNNVNKAEIAAIKGQTAHSKTYNSIAERLLNEHFRRVEEQVPDFGQNDWDAKRD